MRFSSAAELVRPHHKPHCVYGNLLGEKLDFVGRFETLQDDYAHVARTLGLPAAKQTLKFHSSPSSEVMQNSANKTFADLYDDEARAIVGAMYRDDIARYGYEFPAKKTP